MGVCKANAVGRDSMGFPLPSLSPAGAQDWRGFFVDFIPAALCNAQCATRAMDREKMQQYLDQTEKHLATSDKLVEDQKALIALLEERGCDTTQSRTTLAHLEEMRTLHVAVRGSPAAGA
jgi:hypothetical protein